jgi:hypothetical protein
MLARSFTTAVCILALGAPLSYASTDPVVSSPGKDVAVNSATHSAPATGDFDDPSKMSSSVPVATSSAISLGDGTGQARYSTAKPLPRLGVKPFSTVAIQVKAGLAGAGLDLAVPVAGRMNLRVGGNYFQYNPNLVVDGINVVGNIQLRSASANVDVFPFGNAFRITPGVVVYNGNSISAIANVPGGQSFTLNDVSYTSSPTDPVKGTFGLSFGRKVAPSLTMGFGNMIPRRGGHWSVPLEIGGEFIGTAPQISLSLSGPACQTGSIPPACGSIATDPTTQANLAAEQKTLNSNIPSQLKFFPIVSIGLSYKFGRGGSER